MTSGQLVKSLRLGHGLSQRQLALRAGTGQAAISRIERGQTSPSVETLTHLLAAMGEDLMLDAQPMLHDRDPLHARALRERPPPERLALAISWNRLAGRLAAAGRRARNAA